MNLCDNSLCTGCLACLSSCKHNAIQLIQDKNGFTHPIIDNSLCIKCNLCIKKCPVLSPVKLNEPQKAYACHNKNEKERFKSASGGIATLLAQSFINNGDIVYGCAFEQPFEINHIRCTTYEDICRIRNSKYIQSKISKELIQNIKKDLAEHKNVLFIGTPCQIAGIKNLFPTNNGLYLVDLICHGVSSKQFLLDTLPSIIGHTNIKNISFRKKSKYHFSIIDEKDNLIVNRPLSNDTFMKGFFNGLIFRESCYTCKYANQKRISDLTLGDFWGLKSYTIIDRVGVSLVLMNTEKGNNLFNRIINDIKSEERPLNEAFAGNEQLNNPFKKTFRTSIFRYLYPKIGYNKALWCALPDKVLAMHLKHLLKK